MNVRYLIERSVKEYPDRPALVFENRRLNFSDLNNRTNRLSNGLLELGIKKGDRVGILMKNCVEFIETDFALSKTGIVRVPLNARLTGKDHTFITDFHAK